MANVKILVVEDEVIVAKDIADMLKSRGYDVPAIALSGEQAIEKTEQIQPDLVLMDIVLRGDVDGIEAAEQIRRRFGIPVIYLTAYTDEQTVKRAKITEPFGYITKPFDMRELYTNIEMALYKHKAEKALQRSKQEWEKTFDAISDWIALTDLKGRILRTNRSGEDFTGISSAQIVGQSCCKLVHGSEEHIPGCPLQKMLHTRQRESTELKVPDANRWLIVTIDPVIDKEGNLIGAVHITRDITERKQAELSLKEAEAELKHTIEVVPCIIAKANAHTGYFTHCNPALSSILGFSSEEFLARPFIEFIHPDDRQSTINEVEKQLKGSPVAKFENRYICKDGSYKWLEWRATAADEKGVVYAAATDITERKKAEHALTESEEKYRRFYEDAPLGYQSLDASGNFLDVNKKWLNVLGYSKEEVIGRLFADFVAPESLETFVDDFHRFKESGQTRGTEFEMLRKDGSRITVSFDGNIEYDEEGRFRRTHCIMHNITERKKAEEALRESEEHYRMLTETMNDGLGQVDENGRYVYVNNKFGEMLGYSPDEMVGRHWTAFFDENAQKITNEQLIKRRKGISKPYELENTRKDGQKIFLRISPQGIFDADNRYMGSFAIMTDITGRKQADEQIEKLAKFPAEDPNPVLRISGHGTVIYANKASLPLLKVWRCRVGQSLPNPWHEFVLDALSSGQNQQTEAQCDERIFSLTFTPIVKANYVNIYGLDITERKKAEERLLEHQAKLKAH
ncbi:MAG: PAS domain S-box protein [Planctomycetes bacterium]|nr:PAS domain S-box protein [Planctomycetota bacterium]